MDAKKRTHKLPGGGLIVELSPGAEIQHWPFAVFDHWDPATCRAVFLLPDPTFNPHESAESLQQRYRAHLLAESRERRRRLTKRDDLA